MADSEKKERLSGESPRHSEPSTILPTVNVATEKPEPPKAALHPAAYVITWITLSGGVIIFNKYLLSTMGFKYRKKKSSHRLLHPLTKFQQSSSQHGTCSSRL